MLLAVDQGKSRPDRLGSHRRALEDVDILVTDAPLTPALEDAFSTPRSSSPEPARRCSGDDDPAA
ncbi:hypothetical protein ACRAWD_21480 [Caulobacter segnis]